MSVAAEVRVSPEIGSWLGKLRAYVALTKPRIIEQLLITTVPAMIVAERGLPSVWLILATLVGGTLSAGGANAVNMWWDRDIDAVMRRTSRRPIVQGLISPNAALTFAIGLQVFAFAWTAYFVNVLAAALSLSAALFYIFIYTMWLKRSSSSNIVIGGAAGAVPVLVGWAAVTNSLGWAPWLMFTVIFLWTPPHFWALAMKYKDDYGSVNVPMLPVTASPRHTTNQIVFYTVVLLAVTVGMAPVAHLGWLYLVSAGVSGLVFLGYTVQLWRDFSVKTAMKVFHWSITYLTIVFVAMAVDQFLHWPL
jgi:protoheme IX farnesyltransferase